MENKSLHSEQINELVTALAKAQGEISVALYDSKNPHFKSDYASYSAIRKACQMPLSKHGLAITHLLLESDDKKRMMVTQLSHTSGQWMRSHLILPMDKETPQGVGSGITYAKRYTLEALLAIAADEDDDGNAAEEPHKTSNGKENVPVVKEALTAEDKIPFDLAQEIENELALHPIMRNGMLKSFGANLFTDVSMKLYHSMIKPSIDNAKKAKK